MSSCVDMLVRQTGDSLASSLPGSGSGMTTLENGYCMPREFLSAGGNLLGVTRRSHRHAWPLSVPRLAPWVDSITFDGLYKAVIFQGSEN